MFEIKESITKMYKFVHAKLYVNLEMSAHWNEIRDFMTQSLSQFFSLTLDDKHKHLCDFLNPIFHQINLNVFHWKMDQVVSCLTHQIVLSSIQQNTAYTRWNRYSFINLKCVLHLITFDLINEEMKNTSKSLKAAQTNRNKMKI